METPMETPTLHMHFKPWEGNHPASVLYFSRDMVATDSVIYDDLLDEARAGGANPSGYATGFLNVAASSPYQLGTFEMRDVTGRSGYNQIDLIEIDRNKK